MMATKKKEKENYLLTRDLILLSLSFSFTIFVAGFILTHINNNLSKNEKNIEILVQKLVIEKFENIIKYEKYFVRQRDEIKENENSRAKRDLGYTTKGYYAEFFPSTLRPELEKNDSLKKNNWKGGDSKGDNWVWMTAYSRIPFEAIDGFCKRTKEYCPPGQIGVPGVAGQKGQKGEVGPIGPPGWSIKGPPGQKGMRGPKGDHGSRGLDGRDGIPGEPGIDGIPGRAGVDGRHGTDGKNGTDGLKGDNGKPGLQGPKGDPGARGEKGFVGPRGSKGDRGTDGVPGIPGTCLHSCEGFSNLLDAPRTDVVFFNLPPRIPTSLTSSNRNKPIIVTERDNLRLRCSAIGHPRPEVHWKRKDGKEIQVSSDLKVNEIHGKVVNLTNINRVHMGTYVCIASNGIAPDAYHEFPVEVHFKPLVSAEHKTELQKTVNAGETITLNCGSEAFPDPVMYWEREDLTTIGNFTNKYKSVYYSTDTFTFQSKLTLFNISESDINRRYTCVSKNIMGIAKIQFRLSSTGVDIGYYDNSKVVAGTARPNITGIEQMCPIPQQCKECTSAKDMKCKDIITSLNDLIGTTVPELLVIASNNKTSNRTADCELGLVGKPVFYHAIESEKFGAWLRDPVKVDNVTVEKVWLTRGSDKNHLFEYRNKQEYQLNTQTSPDRKLSVTKYTLPCDIEGNAHIIHNNALYYYCKEKLIVRYDLKASSSINITADSIEANTTHKLYTTKYNVIDFNADDNGLWLIHSSLNSNYTIVTKINETTLEIQNRFNISVFHDKLGEMFIACGILYGVDSTTTRNTKIRLALDLYEKKLLDVDINFSNPFNNTSTLGYNHLTKDLYSWSMGNQLTYPVKINALGTNETVQKSIDEILPAGASYSIFRNT